MLFEKALTQKSIKNVPQAQNDGQAPYFVFLVHTFTTLDKVLRYGENNQVDFSEHPTVVQRGNERTINIFVPFLMLRERRCRHERANLSHLSGQPRKDAVVT